MCSDEVVCPICGMLITEEDKRLGNYKKVESLSGEEYDFHKNCYQQIDQDDGDVAVANRKNRFDDDEALRMVGK